MAILTIYRLDGYKMNNDTRDLLIPRSKNSVYIVSGKHNV